MSSFWSSAHQGDTDRLVELLSQGQDVDEYCPAGVSAYRPTALAYAVWVNQPDAVALLLERAGFVIFSENTPFSFLFSFSVGKIFSKIFRFPEQYGVDSRGCSCSRHPRKRTSPRRERESSDGCSTCCTRCFRYASS